MKSFALLFVAALLGGSWGNLFYRDEPKSQWEESLNAFWSYVDNIENMAEGITTQIKSSQISKELDGLITDTMAEFDHYTENFRFKVGPHIQDLQERMIAELKALLDKLRVDLEETKNKLVQYKNEAGVMINHNVDTVRSQMNLLCRKMKKRISKDVTELQNKMAEYASEVRARTDERVEAVRQSLEPYISSIHNKGQQRFQALQQAVEEQGKLLHEQLSGRVRELHSQFREKAEEVQSSLSQVAESTRQWLSPLLQDVTDQIQTMLEKVEAVQSPES